MSPHEEAVERSDEHRQDDEHRPDDVPRKPDQPPGRRVKPPRAFGGN